MPAAHLLACSGNAWLRPGGVDAITTTRVLPPNAQVVLQGPSDTKACEPRPPSTPRESSLSLELREVSGAFSTPLFGCRNIQAGCSNGGEESVGEQREGDVTIPAVPAPHLVVGQSHLSFGLLKADLHPPPSAAGRLRPRLERNTLGREDRIRAEFFRVLDGAAHHEPPLEAFLHRRVERQPPPVVEPGSFRALPG